MVNLPKIECSFPRYDILASLSNDRFLVSPDLILTSYTPYVPFRLEAVTLQRRVRYLIAYNRTTQGWAAPLRFPAPFDHYDMQLQLSGVMHRRTVVALSSADSGNAIHFFDLGARLDTLTATRSVDLSWRGGPLDCIAFMPLPSSFYMLLSTSSMWSAQQPLQNTICAYNSSTATTVEHDVAALDGIACTYAFIYKDEFYVLCGDNNREQTMFVLRNDQLERVTGCKELASTCRFFGPPVRSLCGSRFMVSFRYSSWQSKVAVYDLETNKWMAKVIHIGCGHIFFHAFRGVDGVSQGELLVPAYVAKREGLCALWLLPPKLRAIAFRAIQQSLPTATVERLKKEPKLFDAMDVAVFLLDSGRDATGGPESSQ